MRFFFITVKYQDCFPSCHKQQWRSLDWHQVKRYLTSDKKVFWHVTGLVGWPEYPPVAGWGHPTWNACKLMASMTDVSTNEPKVYGCCQQEFINRHVCICARLSIHPSLSSPLCITVAVVVIQWIACEKRWLQKQAFAIPPLWRGDSE